MVNAGLVLEGGGMRGVYTSGILDYFMEKGLLFSHIYGVSAGACNMASYISNQIGRQVHVSTDYLDDKDYCSAYSLIKTGDLFGVDYCYNRIPNELNKYDYEKAANYPGNAYAVATNIETGRPAYFQIKDMYKDIRAIQASASLPIVSRVVEIEGKKYLDGGLSDSIPIRKAVRDGNQKNVVILTRPEGYRKKPTSAANLALIRQLYKDYPKLIEDTEQRHIHYNKTLRYLENEVKHGRAFVFYPEMLVKIGRIEKDPKKLKVLYLEGYHDAATRYEEMMEFLQS